jgi:hypothetical protein
LSFPTKVKGLKLLPTKGCLVKLFTKLAQMDTSGQRHAKSFFFTYSETGCLLDPRRGRTQRFSGYDTKRNTFASVGNHTPVLQSYSPLHNYYAAKLSWPVEAGIMVRMRSLQPRRSGSILEKGKICSFFLHAQTGGIEPTSYSLRTGVSFPKGREIDHSPPSGVEVWNGWSFTSTPRHPYALMPYTPIPLPF